MIRLVCPLCSTTIADGREPEVGEACPGCSAIVLGGGNDPISGVAAALDQNGDVELPVDEVARALFALAAPDPRARLAGITSDERDGFYRWWVLVRNDEGDVLESLLDPADSSDDTRSG